MLSVKLKKMKKNKEKKKKKTGTKIFEVCSVFYRSFCIFKIL